MSDDTKDTLAFWGLMFVGILAMGYSYDHFGAKWGNLALVPLILIGRRVFTWCDDLRYFRHLDEDRHRQDQEPKSPSS
jgi:hypothetical protein